MLANSKYGNLPDIDTESPEVFESVDVVTVNEDQVPEDSLEETEGPQTEDSVEQTQMLSVSGAAQIFRAKEQQARTLKKSSSGLARGRKEALYSSETRAQRLNRLSVELYELRKEVEEDTAAPKKSMEAVKAQLSSLDAVMSALTQAQVSDPDSVKELMARLASSNFESSKGGVSALLASIRQPASSYSSRQSEKLESRLVALEKMVGASLDQPFVQPPSGDILSSLSKLEHQLSLVSEPDSQDRLIARFKELNMLLSKNPSAFAADDKINTLYKTLDLPTLKSIPQILKRLVALKDIHSSASSMTDTLHKLETRVQTESKAVTEAQQALVTLQETMKTNAGRIHANLSVLSERVDALNGRLAGMPHKDSSV